MSTPVSLAPAPIEQRPAQRPEVLPGIPVAEIGKDRYLLPKSAEAEVAARYQTAGMEFSGQYVPPLTTQISSWYSFTGERPIGEGRYEATGIVLPASEAGKFQGIKTITFGGKEYKLMFGKTSGPSAGTLAGEITTPGQIKTDKGTYPVSKLLPFEQEGSVIKAEQEAQLRPFWQSEQNIPIGAAGPSFGRGTLAGGPPNLPQITSTPFTKLRTISMFGEKATPKLPIFESISTPTKEQIGFDVRATAQVTAYPSPEYKRPEKQVLFGGVPLSRVPEETLFAIGESWSMAGAGFTRGAAKTVFGYAPLNATEYNATVPGPIKIDIFGKNVTFPNVKETVTWGQMAKGLVSEGGVVAGFAPQIIGGAMKTGRLLVELQPQPRVRSWAEIKESPLRPGSAQEYVVGGIAQQMIEFGERPATGLIQIASGALWGMGIGKVIKVVTPKEIPKIKSLADVEVTERQKLGDIPKGQPLSQLIDRELSHGRVAMTAEIIVGKTKGEFIAKDLFDAWSGKVVGEPKLRVMEKLEFGIPKKQPFDVFVESKGIIVLPSELRATIAGFGELSPAFKIKPSPEPQIFTSEGVAPYQYGGLLKVTSTGPFGKAFVEKIPSSFGAGKGTAPTAPLGISYSVIDMFSGIGRTTEKLYTKPTAQIFYPTGTTGKVGTLMEEFLSKGKLFEGTGKKPIATVESLTRVIQQKVEHQGLPPKVFPIGLDELSQKIGVMMKGRAVEGTPSLSQIYADKLLINTEISKMARSLEAHKLAETPVSEMARFYQKYRTPSAKEEVGTYMNRITKEFDMRQAAISTRLKSAMPSLGKMKVESWIDLGQETPQFPLPKTGALIALGKGEPKEIFTSARRLREFLQLTPESEKSANLELIKGQGRKSEDLFSMFRREYASKEAEMNKLRKENPFVYNMAKSFEELGKAAREKEVGRLGILQAAREAKAFRLALKRTALEFTKPSEELTFGKRPEVPRPELKTIRTGDIVKVPIIKVLSEMLKKEEATKEAAGLSAGQRLAHIEKMAEERQMFQAQRRYKGWTLETFVRTAYNEELARLNKAKAAKFPEVPKLKFPFESKKAKPAAGPEHKPPAGERGMLQILKPQTPLDAEITKKIAEEYQKTKAAQLAEAVKSVTTEHERVQRKERLAMSTMLSGLFRRPAELKPNQIMKPATGYIGAPPIQAQKRKLLLQIQEYQAIPAFLEGQQQSQMRVQGIAQARRQQGLLQKLEQGLLQVQPQAQAQVQVQALARPQLTGLFSGMAQAQAVIKPHPHPQPPPHPPPTSIFLPIPTRKGPTPMRFKIESEKTKKGKPSKSKEEVPLADWLYRETSKMRGAIMSPPKSEAKRYFKKTVGLRVPTIEKIALLEMMRRRKK